MSAVKDQILANEAGICYSDYDLYVKSLSFDDRILFWTDVWFMQNKFQGQILDLTEVWSELPSKPDQSDESREYVIYVCKAAMVAA